jgi:hypothetical protein
MEMPSIGNADLDRDERIMESLRALIFFSSSSGRRTALGTAEVSSIYSLWSCWCHQPELSNKAITGWGA